MVAAKIRWFSDYLASMSKVAAISLGAIAVLAHAPLKAGECVGATSAPAIIAAIGDAHPDSLSHEARYILGCLDAPLDNISWRAPMQLPSWRLLRNTRRELRNLGRNKELVGQLKRIAVSGDTAVRRRAYTALALYGDETYCDSLDVRIVGLENYLMILAFVGSPGGDRLGIANFDKSNRKPMLLDALYYQSTDEVIEFINRVAKYSLDPELKERAQWMMGNPMPVAKAWEL